MTNRTRQTRLQHALPIRAAFDTIVRCTSDEFLRLERGRKRKAKPIALPRLKWMEKKDA